HRVILFDKRGVGLSDRVANLTSVQERLDDIRVVLDAAGSERPVVFGASEGGGLGALFAAVHPERTRALVTFGSTARMLKTTDYPHGIAPVLLDALIVHLREHWGDPKFVEVEAPSMASDAVFVEWLSTYIRMA